VSLSVCCLTNGPAPRVATSLALLRPVADEIVVGIDDRVDAAEVQILTGVADRAFLIEHVEPAERSMAWLHRQCSCDWILRIDSDEVPSADLIELLPALTAPSGLRQMYLQRRWVFPDASHWLDEIPWNPDLHNRLLCNDASILRFPGLVHSDPIRADPVAFCAAPLYKLCCIVLSSEDRAGKALQHESPTELPRAPGGGLVNEVFYLPEVHARLPAAAIPKTDADLIASVLAPRPVSADAIIHDDAPWVAREELDRHWAGRMFPEEAYRARLDIVSAPRPTLPPDNIVQLLIRVENRGVETWDWGFELPQPIVLSHHWHSIAKSPVNAESLPCSLPHALGPGESLLVPAPIRTPMDPGDYVVEFDLLHAGVRWFGCSVDAQVTVSGKPGERPPLVS
jgi:hypothetical protein